MCWRASKATWRNGWRSQRRPPADKNDVEEEETMSQIAVNAPNRWRLDTPGAAQWPHSARPDAAKKYFMASADGHANEPANLWFERMDKKYHERLPRVVTDKDGVQWRYCEGYRPDRLRLSTLEGEDMARNKPGPHPPPPLPPHAPHPTPPQSLFPHHA